MSFPSTSQKSEKRVWHLLFVLYVLNLPRIMDITLSLLCTLTLGIRIFNHILFCMTFGKASIKHLCKGRPVCLWVWQVIICTMHEVTPFAFDLNTDSTVQATNTIGSQVLAKSKESCSHVFGNTCMQVYMYIRQDIDSQAH